MLLCFGFDIVFFAIFSAFSSYSCSFFLFLHIHNDVQTGILCSLILCVERDTKWWYCSLSIEPITIEERENWPAQKIWNQTNKRANEQTSRTRQLNNIAIIMIVVLSIQILANATFQHLCANPRASPCNSMIIKQLLKLDHLFIYEKSLSL